MWIRSQEKSLLINAEVFYIEERFEVEEKRKYFKIYAAKDNDRYSLGIYTSREKANSILTRIGRFVNSERVFYMPADEEVND